MQSTASKKSNVPTRMKGPVNFAMTQPRRQASIGNAGASAKANSQLDPNWQQKANSANRYQPSSTFLPRQSSASQNERPSTKISSAIGNTNRRTPNNAFDAKAFLRAQQPGQFMNSNRFSSQQQSQQQQQKQQQQMQTRQTLVAKTANFDIESFKRVAPRLEQEKKAQPLQTAPKSQSVSSVQPILQKQENIDKDEDVDDKLPWQAASQKVANRLQKGASSKEILQKLAIMRKPQEISQQSGAQQEQKETVIKDQDSSEQANGTDSSEQAKTQEKTA